MTNTVSVVIPAYNEESSLHELYRRIMTSIHEMKKSGIIGEYELLFINDGSTDATLYLLVRKVYMFMQTHLKNYYIQNCQLEINGLIIWIY